MGSRWMVRRLCRKCRLVPLLYSLGRNKVKRVFGSLASYIYSVACSPCAILTCVILVSLAVLIAHVMLIYWNVRYTLRADRVVAHGSSIDARLLRSSDDEVANNVVGKKPTLKELDSQLYALVVQHSPNLDHNRRIIRARRAYTRAFRWLEQSRNLAEAALASQLPDRKEKTHEEEEVKAARKVMKAKLTERYRYCPYVPPAFDYAVSSINHVHDSLRVQSFTNVTAALLLINNVPKYSLIISRLLAISSGLKIDLQEPFARVVSNRSTFTQSAPVFELALQLATQINHFNAPFWSGWLRDAHKGVTNPAAGLKLNAGGLCAKRHRVAIIVPYRDRAEHLFVLLAHLHVLLSKQLIDYAVFVVEQGGSGQFNKARVMNAGFLEIIRRSRFDCYIFHDVDLVPEDDRVLYSCSSNPKHLTVAIDEMDYVLAYPELVGGALVFSEDHFLTVNGYSNMFWGWGAEDDDEAYRIMHVGLRILRPPANVARYTMMKHTKRKPADWRRRTKLLHLSTKRYMLDGLNNLNYSVRSYNHYPLYTHIVVDIDLDVER